MARAFGRMTKRAATGRRRSINISLAARVHQLEVFCFELAAAVANESLNGDDIKEAAAELQRYIEEMKRAS